MSASVLLVSAISLRRMSSFRLQLQILKDGLEKRGVRSTIVGIGETGSKHDLPTLDRASHAALLDQTDAGSTILLGYSDQFPLLSEEPSGPCFLWAQLSRKPSSTAPNATVVPLTEMTRSFAQNAGWRMGPTIPHAVDTTLFAPRRSHQTLGYTKTTVAFLTVGANSLRKRFDRLIDAFLLARRELQGSGIDARLTIKTDAGVKAGGFELDQLCCRSADCAIRIITNDLSAEELANLYRAHDIYVHAAEWEGFGIPVAEALASGLPVICPAGQGPAELLPNNRTVVPAVHTDPDLPESVRLVDTAALGRQMVRLATDQNVRAELGVIGRRHACRHFSIDVVAGSWLDILPF